MKKEKISVIVPCFNEQEALPYFYEEIKKIEKEMNFLDFEYIFVEDGSKDKTLEILRDFSKKDKHVRYLSLSRNFGKEASMYAGLKYATGDYVTIMDADLQDPPTLLPEMYKYIKEEGYDQVATRRANRKGEPIIRSFFAKMFYKIINKMSKVEMVDGARDFRLMKRQVVDSILELSEYNRYSKGLFSFVGYNTKWIEYNNIERVAGKTKWSFWKLFKYAIEGITAFSTVPLAFASFLGVLMCLLAVVFIIIIIVKTIIYGDPVGGWPSLACIILFTSGVQLLCLGIIGQYLSKAYLESKNRPIYIIKEHDNN
jgi:glycosyltransferase involved in cell wall biosynthesis